MRDTRRGFFKALAALAVAPALPAPTGYRPTLGPTTRLFVDGLPVPLLPVSDELLEVSSVDVTAWIERCLTVEAYRPGRRGVVLGID